MARNRNQTEVRDVAVMTSLTKSEAQQLRQLAFDRSAETGKRVTVSDLIRDLILRHLLSAAADKQSKSRRPRAGT